MQRKKKTSLQYSVLSLSVTLTEDNSDGAGGHPSQRSIPTASSISILSHLTPLGSRCIHPIRSTTPSTQPHPPMPCVGLRAPPVSWKSSRGSVGRSWPRSRPSAQWLSPWISVGAAMVGRYTSTLHACIVRDAQLCGCRCITRVVHFMTGLWVSHQVAV